MTGIATDLAIEWVERGYVPQPLIRIGIRQLLRKRLQDLRFECCASHAQHLWDFQQAMDAAPIAVLAHKANEQHYEVPAEFFKHTLGPRRKYSCGYWPNESTTLEQAENHALAITCERADLRPGMRILELGCGWGSLTLWMAEHFPDTHIVAVSNSISQRAFIESELDRRGISNVSVITADMNHFATQERFDRVLSIEMFEHMRNYRQLLSRINRWLNPSGKLFVHVFCHRSTPYEFAERAAGDWMSRHFFSGGIMPDDALLLRTQHELRLERQWRWSGQHYQRTAEAWLANLETHRAELWPVLVNTYGAEYAKLWFQRWRVFFLACAEMFGYRGGAEWWVSHYLFDRGDSLRA